MKTISNIRGKRLVLLLILCMLTPIAISTTALAQDEPLLVTGITLNQSELDLVAEEEPGLLIATIEPEEAANQTVIWSSSDETIVQWLMGRLCRLYWIAIIIAITEDGDCATCEVTEKRPPCTCTSVWWII